MTSKKTSIAIIGAGISGLSLAHYIKKACPDCDLHIFEKEPIPGGFIQPQIKGFESGPHIFTSSRALELLSLIEDLGLNSKLRFANKGAKRRYIFHEGKLECLPYSLRTLLFSSYSLKLLGALCKDLFAKVHDEDESIYDFCVRHFGKALTLKLFDPLAIGIWAGDIKELSVSACFSSLKTYDRRDGSVFLGYLKDLQKKRQKGNLFTLEGGMGELIEALAESNSDNLYLSSPVQEISYVSSGICITANGKEQIFDKVVIALPKTHAAQLIRPLDSTLSSLIDSIECKSIHVVNLAFNKLKNLPLGFGYLVPSYENSCVLGAIFDSKMFPSSSDKDIITVMVRGEEKNPLESAKEALAKHLAISAPATHYQERLWKEAIPQYTLGHVNKIKEIENRLQKFHQRLFLTGNFLNGVAVNDCIRSARCLVPLVLRGF